MTETRLLEPGEKITITVPEDTRPPAERIPERIDQFLARTFTGHSRTFFQELVKSGLVNINGSPEKRVSTSVKTGDAIDFSISVVEKKTHDSQKINGLPIEVVHEHEHFIVLAKPAGLITHQASSRSASVSLADWISLRYRDIAETFVKNADDNNPDRPGIVHRLDKDTSGLMVVARTQHAYAQFTEMFKARTIKKTYNALVEGQPEPSGTIDFNIERHPTIPTKMAYRLGSGREATTHYTALEYFKNHALLELKPVTGRTHQIRVHCMAMGHPVVGDALYGRTSPLIRRQALHAKNLTFEFDGQVYKFNQELPDDFQEALKRVRNPHAHR